MAERGRVQAPARGGRHVNRNALVRAGVLVVLGLVLPGLACKSARDVVIVCEDTAQLIRGFGTALNHWDPEVHALYRSPEFAKRYVHELGVSLIRIPLHPAVLREAIADPEAIRRQDFAHRSRYVAPVLDFVQSAMAQDPDIGVIATVWTPPGWMKTNRAEKGGGQLRADRREHFARYLVEWVRLLEEQYDITLRGLSIQNEPHFTQDFESCTYTPEAYRETLQVVGRTFDEAGVDVPLIGPEDMTHALARTRSYVDSALTTPEGQRRLRAIATHGLWSDAGPEERSPFFAMGELARDLGLELWLTETSGDTVVGRDGKVALLDTLALGLHRALTAGGVSAWLYWQVSAGDGGEAQALMDGAEPSFKYAVMRHWSGFVRPGARRVGVQPEPAGLEVSAFHRPESSELSIVALNRNASPERLSLRIDCREAASSLPLHLHQTTPDQTVERLLGVGNPRNTIGLVLPPHSLTTLHRGPLRPRAMR